MNTSSIPEPRPGRYRHYKGKDYRVLGLARHSETEEQVVVYQLLYSDFSWWVRPRSMFLESVEIDGKIVPRFQYIAES
ncbi:MAG TPA: DUF1653 domain-containing protein [Opitutaceae bacterium]